MAILWPAAREYLEEHHQEWLTEMKRYHGYQIYSHIAHLEPHDMRRIIVRDPARVLSFFAIEHLPTIAENFRYVDQLIMI
jgi:hypothetical protein